MIAGFLLLAAAGSAITMTLTKGSIFASLRDWLADRPFLGQLISCPYCTSHWVAAAIVWATGWRAFDGNPWLTYPVTVFALVAAIAPFSWVIYNSYSKMHPLE